MKKTLFIIIFALTFTGLATAEEKIVVPCCGSVDDIVKIIKKNDSEIITRLEKGEGMWLAECTATDGSKRQYTITCRNCEIPKSKKTVKISLPPADGISLIDLTAKINAEYKGEIKKIEYKDNKWIVCLVTNKIEKQMLFDTKGKLISMSAIN